MKTNKFGEQIYSEDDVCDLVMQGHDLSVFEGMFVDRINIEEMAHILENVPTFIEYDAMARENLTQEAYDHRCQSTWFMPDEYRELDIAAHVLSLCQTDAELQRVGQELLLYQERNLFDLLKYLTSPLVQLVLQKIQLL